MRLCIINLCPRARLSTRSSTAASGCSVADQVRSAALLPAILFSAVSEFHLGEEEKTPRERKLASRAGAKQRFCWFDSWFFSFRSIAHTDHLQQMFSLGSLEILNSYSLLTISLGYKFKVQKRILSAFNPMCHHMCSSTENCCVCLSPVMIFRVKVGSVCHTNFGICCLICGEITEHRCGQSYYRVNTWSREDSGQI